MSAEMRSTDNFGSKSNI